MQRTAPTSRSSRFTTIGTGIALSIFPMMLTPFRSSTGIATNLARVMEIAQVKGAFIPPSIKDFGAFSQIYFFFI